MTTQETGVISRAGDPAKVEEDKNKVRDYVKQDLFECAVFVWNKSTVEKGGALHKDYLKNCRTMLAGGSLIDASDRDMDAYMNVLWTVLEKDNSYR